MRELIATACNPFRDESGAPQYEVIFVTSEPSYDMQDGKLVSSRQPETFRFVCDRLQLKAIAENMYAFAGIQPAGKDGGT